MKLEICVSKYIFEYIYNADEDVDAFADEETVDLLAFASSSSDC